MSRVADGGGRQPSAPGATSRREVLRRLGLLGAGAVLAPSVLAACGDDDDDVAPADASGPPSSSPSSGASAGAIGEELQTLLQIDPEGQNGQGVSWKMGAVLALTGQGSFYGQTMTRGIDLAVKHIAAAGGPNIQVVYKDHKSGDAQASTQAITELGTSGIPAKLASYGDGLLAMLPGTAQYKVFTLDGGGGAAGLGEGQPYFWGTRAQTPGDARPGLYQYIKDTLPEARTVGLTGWDLGAANNEQGRTELIDSLGPAGLEFNGLYELFPPNTTDYSGTLAKIKANQPDVLLVFAYGQDPGFFLDQAQTQALDSAIFGFEFTPDGVSASKGAYDRVGWTFAFDFFDPNGVTSDFGELFVREFRAEYGEDPDFYAANYYEDTFGMWDIIRRVLAKDGDINDGAQLDAAFQEDLVLASVYGGDGTTIGTFECDPVSHSVKRRQLGVFEYKDGTVTTKALFNIDGADYELL